MLFTMFVVTMVLTAISGIYCLIATHNLIRSLIAMELLGKSATLLIAIAGVISGQMAEAEGFIITMIIVEVVVTAVGAAICIAIYARTGSLDFRKLRGGKEASKGE
ncbi:MAG: NADH-quinone oxidoreductase subunit K [Actinomycetia bacterium]|nr:NADH-quinone oxidoreductase subunit K [Actinomycetes bacterium]